jgi:C4-dicarboxylate-specific signal transduction histidine kinase
MGELTASLAHEVNQPIAAARTNANTCLRWLAGDTPNIVLLRGETTRYNILVGTDLAADLPQVMADRVQLQQVLMNLMINGIEAMKDADGTRELAVRSQRMQDEEVVVSVSATGVGLPPQQMEQIFNAFFYYQAARDRHGTSHQPLHHRIAGWPLVGCRQRPARRKLLFHPTHQSRGV